MRYSSSDHRVVCVAATYSKLPSCAISWASASMLRVCSSSLSACLRAVTSWMIEKSVGRPWIVTGVEYTSTMRTSPPASRCGKVNMSLPCSAALRRSAATSSGGNWLICSMCMARNCSRECP